jgi:hypothetical protein
MTVQELIERLTEMDPEMEVHIKQPSHDHWHTMLAPEVCEVDELEVKSSAYHSEDVIADGDHDEHGTRMVVVIS